MNKFLVWLFCALFAIGFIVNIFVNPPDFSEAENRYLTKFPKISVNELFFGDYTTKLDDFIRDHFFAREFWVGLKAGTEVILQKKENNSVIFGQDGYLIESPTVIDEKQLEKNCDKVAAFLNTVEASGKNAYFALIPNASLALNEKLPFVYPIDATLDMLLTLENDKKLNTVNLYDALYAHQDEYIFYRTDHHWTSLGAYYAYVELCKAMGYESKDLSEFKQSTVTENFFGTMYSKSGAKWAKPDSINLMEIEKNSYTVTLDDGKEKFDSMFFEKHLDKKDKYSVFLDGNHAIVKVVNQNGNGKKVLFVKDSFTHTLAPLFAADFSEVHMLDLRYYRGSVTNYMSENDIDDVVVIYGATNFFADTNIAFIR